MRGQRLEAHVGVREVLADALALRPFLHEPPLQRQQMDVRGDPRSLGRGPGVVRRQRRRRRDGLALRSGRDRLGLERPGIERRRRDLGLDDVVRG
jgi:hypothetical protein